MRKVSKVVQGLNKIKTEMNKKNTNKLKVLGVVCIIGFSVIGTPLLPTSLATTGYYVDPEGSDSADGTSVNTAFRSIQKALDVAEPGDTINLQQGIYHERITTKRPGRPNAPITIKGPESGTDPAQRRKALLYGTDHVFDIDHSHYVIEGFTIDGQEKLASRTIPDDWSKIEEFKNANQSKIEDGRLIYIGHNGKSGITDIKINNMYLTGGGGECIRIRNDSDNNEVTNSLITYCGMYKKGRDENYPYHNGEGVYIGTSPKSTDQPFAGKDFSSGNLVKNNIIRTYASECVDIKEQANANIIENNECQYSLEYVADETDGSIIEIRGYNNQLLRNHMSDGKDFGIKIKSDDSGRYNDGGNVIKNNSISKVVSGGIYLEKSSEPQGEACGNSFPGISHDKVIVGGGSIPHLTEDCPSGSAPASAPSG